MWSLSQMCCSCRSSSANAAGEHPLPLPDELLSQFSSTLVWEDCTVVRDIGRPWWLSSCTWATWALVATGSCSLPLKEKRRLFLCVSSSLLSLVCWECVCLIFNKILLLLIIFFFKPLPVWLAKLSSSSAHWAGVAVCWLDVWSYGFLRLHPGLEEQKGITMECTWKGYKCPCSLPSLCVHWCPGAYMLCGCAALCPFPFEPAESCGRCRHLCGWHSRTCKRGDVPA